MRFASQNRDLVDVYKRQGGLRWSPYTTIAAIPGANLLAPQSGTDHVHTGFVQDEVRLGAQVSVTGGAKLQENNFNGFDVQPSVRLLWTAGEHQSVWGGITRAITTPSDLEEKFFLQGPEGPSTYIQVLGNKNFKSEDVIGYEAGYRLLASDRFYFDLSPFWNQYSKLQSFSAPAVSSSGGNTYITILYENQIAGHTTGFEFAPKVAIARWWQLNSSYSFVSSTFSANGPTSNISSTGSVPTYEMCIRDRPKAGGVANRGRHLGCGHHPAFQLREDPGFGRNLSGVRGRTGQGPEGRSRRCDARSG